MALTDPNLGLTYGWTLGESGWHTGMDANLKRLGAVVGLSVKDRDLTAPPASPADGDRYIIATGATGAWAGKDGQIAVWIGGAWEFYTPKIGWLCYIEDEDKLSVYKATGWSAAAEAIAAHEADPDPHPQYTTDVEAQVIAQYERAAHESAYPHPEFVRADFAATHRLTTDATTGVLLLEEL